MNWWRRSVRYNPKTCSCRVATVLDLNAIVASYLSLHKNCSIKLSLYAANSANKIPKHINGQHSQKNLTCYLPTHRHSNADLFLWSLCSLDIMISRQLPIRFWDFRAYNRGPLEEHLHLREARWRWQNMFLSWCTPV